MTETRKNLIRDESKDANAATPAFALSCFRHAFVYTWLIVEMSCP